ncbi:hypothetical protein CES86_1001 [Brucella lupini]|uniref:Uncharacterized protein n=1 Tax=Brucella lupini TaxID=255457 RepID=A0A256GX10_9HYPH|nr:hypothetical protein CES86_1001 [Brucella lupini]
MVEFHYCPPPRKSMPRAPHCPQLALIETRGLSLCKRNL